MGIIYKKYIRSTRRHFNIWHFNITEWDKDNLKNQKTQFPVMETLHTTKLSQFINLT